MGQIGAGKSVMSKQLCSHLGAVHLGIGQLLRDSYSDHPSLKSGELVPDNLVFKAVGDFISYHKNSTIVIDGFPRNQAQEEWLNEFLLSNPQQHLKAVFVLEVDDKTAIKRLQGRGREDDTEQAIVHRMSIFEQDVQPVINYYDKQGLVVRIDANQDPEEVFAEIKEHLPQ